jgi:hypothetical protein
MWVPMEKGTYFWILELYCIERGKGRRDLFFLLYTILPILFTSVAFPHINSNSSFLFFLPLNHQSNVAITVYSSREFISVCVILRSRTR